MRGTYLILTSFLRGVRARINKLNIEIQWIPAEPDDIPAVHRQFLRQLLGLGNIIFGVVLALGIASVKAVLDAQGLGAPLCYSAVTQIAFGMLMWAIYVRNMLLFLAVPIAKNEKVSMLTAEIRALILMVPLVFVLAYYVTVPKPSVLLVAHIISLDVSIEQPIRDVARLEPRLIAPAFFFGLFFVTMFGFGLWFSRRPGISRSLKLEIQDVAWSSLFVAAFLLFCLIWFAHVEARLLLLVSVGAVLIVIFCWLGAVRRARIDYLKKPEQSSDGR